MASPMIPVFANGRRAAPHIGAVEQIVAKRMRSGHRRSGLALSALCFLCFGAPLAAEPRLVAAEPAPLTPKEAGARYGQAAGVAIACYWLQPTSRVKDLRARFSGAELSEFDAEAAQVLAAWKKAAICTQAEGPNQCKLSIVYSCRQAKQEIGPTGTAVPGLVELRSRPASK